jgi:hypothetical protein
MRIQPHTLTRRYDDWPLAFESLATARNLRHKAPYVPRTSPAPDSPCSWVQELPLASSDALVESELGSFSEANPTAYRGIAHRGWQMSIRT